MALVSGTLIEDAKLQAFPYMREDYSATGPLLRHLTTLDREVVDLFAFHTPERLSTEQTDVAIVSGNNSTGYALSTAKYYTEFIYVESDDAIRYPIEIVPEGKRPSRHPAAHIRGFTLYPIDPFERDWASEPGERPFWVTGDAFEYRYVVDATRMTALNQNLASPDEAEQYIVNALVFQLLLLYGAGVPQERLQSAQIAVEQAKLLLLHGMAHRTGVSSRYGEGKEIL